MRLSTLLLCFFFFQINSNLSAQLPQKAIDYIKNDTPKESIYIHFDKENYVSGETAWFKVYVMQGRLPGDMSSSITVELIDDAGTIVAKKILPVINSTAVGEFFLKAGLSQKNYTVRAYTRNLMNFGNEYFYEKKLTIYNPSAENKTEGSTSEELINFFPEGGNLVAGLMNVVAFKSTDKFGNPLKSKGEISDSKEKSIVKFESVHDGMGKFSFTPAAGETYSASCTISGKSKKVNLPAAKNMVLIQVSNEHGLSYLTINQEKVTDENAKAAYVTMTMEKKVVGNQKIASWNNTLKSLLTLDEYPSGILLLTLFNKNDQPLAERLLFINNDDLLLPTDLKAETISKAKRGKNIYSFEIADTTSATFSIAITDFDREIQSDSRENIISRIMLQNNIKDRINDPLYYFENNSKERQEHLDLVMMTSGWRRFNWDNVFNDKHAPVSIKDEDHINFKAKAYGQGNKLLSDEKLNIFLNTGKGETQLLSAFVDKQGVVEMPGLIFSDTATLFYQPDVDKKQTVQLSPFNVPLSKLFNYGTQNNIAPSSPVSATNTELVKRIYTYAGQINDQPVISLEEVKVEAKQKTPQEKTRLVRNRYLTGVHSSGTGKIIDLVTNPDPRRNYYANIFEYLQANEPSVRVTKESGGWFINYRNTMTITKGLVPMRVLLDGVQIDYATLETIRFNSVAMIQILGAGFVGAEGNGATGTLAIFTKKGEDLETVQKATGTTMNSVKVEGYSPVKEFFSPDYETEKNSPGQDARTTLYWNPYLETNAENKKVTIQFFNSDFAKKFKVVLTGVNGNGKFVYVEKIIDN